MSFVAPVWLLTLLLVPLALAGYLALERRRARYAVEFTNIGVLAEVVDRRASLRRYVPLAFLLAAIVALCVAAARPTISLATPAPRATVMLVVDTSGSMRAEDVEPTRLHAAQAAVRVFLDSAPVSLRISLLSFADEPQVLIPPTRDRSLLYRGVELLTPGSGTALGDAVVRAVELGERVRELDAAPVEADSLEEPREEEPLIAMVVLSDGADTRSLVQPLDGAAEAKAGRMPVHTVVLGTDEGRVVVFERGDISIEPVPPDRETLAQMAELTGGNYYEAADADELKSVYQGLSSDVGQVQAEREATVGFVLGGAVLLLSAAVVAGVWLPRLP